LEDVDFTYSNVELAFSIYESKPNMFQTLYQIDFFRLNKNEFVPNMCDCTKYAD